MVPLTNPRKSGLTLAVALLVGMPIFSLARGAVALEPFATGPLVRQATLPNFEYWRDLCQIQRQAGQYAVAQASCEMALQLRPDDGALWAAQTDTLLKLGQYSEAVAATQQSLALQPRSSLALAQQCKALLRLSQPQPAQQACDRAVQINDNWGDMSLAMAWLYQGQAMAQQQDFEGALVAYERALLSNRENSEVLTYRCAAYLSLGNEAAALESCEAATTANALWGDADPALANYYRGRAYQKKEDYAAAVEAFDAALRWSRTGPQGPSHPQDSLIWLAQGQALAASGNAAEALLSYNRAVASRPDWSEVLLGQCAMLNQTDQYEAALTACNQALSGDGAWGDAEAAQAWSQQAQAFTGLGRYADALAATNRAVGLNPQSAEAWNNRGAVQGYLEDWQGAIASLQKAAELDPTYASPWVNVGRLQRRLGNFEQALTAYDQAVALDPDDAEIWANRSGVQWYLRQYEPALTSADKAIRLNERSYLGWYNRATALFSLERYREAGRAYQQAMRIDPASADAWTGMGVVLARLQRYDEARRVLAKALELNPQQAVAQQTWRSLPPIR